MSPEEKFKRFFGFFDSNVQSEKTTSNKNPIEEIEKINCTIEKKEEKQKRKLRINSFKLISHLIWFQLGFFDVIVFLIISSIVLNIKIFNDLNNDVVVLLLEFLKYYIGATIVELLGMLFFVIQFVFSKYNRINKKVNDS